MVSEDGKSAICARIESPKKVGDAGWLHKLSDVTAKPAPRRPKKPPVPLADMLSLAVRCFEAVTNYRSLCAILGVSAKTLERMMCGWDGRNWTFPMRDYTDKVIGIRLRTAKGKLSVPGSKNGLFIPENVLDCRTLYICEGESDCAAMLELGFACIGRPNCLTGNDLIAKLLKGKKRDVVIMADNDEPKLRADGTFWRPGLAGAYNLAAYIFPVCESLKIVTPPRHKDIRAWLQSGASKAMVECIVTNTQYYNERIGAWK